ncbi:MAG: hypothetical protein K0S06_3230 [Microvirga sp.]|jgi:uncharacterized protein (DUF2336 family)|nr:hypothetical protein [Microvirga sp.]
MPKVEREINDALKAVALTRRYFQAEEPKRRELDLQLWRMLKQGSAILRAEMAEHLVRRPNGPPITLRALACDPEPEVALPVLRLSDAISDAALAEIARCKSEDHQIAIAARPHINSRVAAVVARRGSPRVLETLARNPAAEIDDARVEQIRRRLRRPRVLRSAKPLGDGLQAAQLH